MILSLFIRLKIANISRSLMASNIEIVTSILYNTPSEIVKKAALDFLINSLLLFPNCVAYKLQEIRDLARECLVDDNETVAQLASALYILVFRFVHQDSKIDFQEYLTSELYTLNAENSDIAADPWLSKLNHFEMTSNILHSSKF